MIDDFTRGASSVVPFAGGTAITTSEIVTVARESVARRLGRRNILQFYTTSKACLPLARDCLSIIWTLVDNISCARLFLTSFRRLIRRFSTAIYSARDVGKRKNMTAYTSKSGMRSLSSLGNSSRTRITNGGSP